MSFNTVCATNVTFWKIASNCGIIKQALENRPNEFHGIVDHKMLQQKFVKNS